MTTHTASPAAATINLVDDLNASPVHLPSEATKPAVEIWIRSAATAAAEQLRWIYTLNYRRHHRNIAPSRSGDVFADQIANANLRCELPAILSRHLPGIALVEWADPHPAIVDSSWTLHGWHMAVYWNYHPGWTIGDATDLRVHPVPADRADEVSA